VIFCGFFICRAAPSHASARRIEMKHQQTTARVILWAGSKIAKQHPMWQQDAYRMIQRRARAVIHIYLRDGPIEQSNH